MPESSLYRRVMGEAFDGLDAEVQAFHSLHGHLRLHGHCVVHGPQRFAARWLARIMGLPLHEGGAAFSFELRADTRSECWTRLFPGGSMRSVLCEERGELVERLGPARLHFRLRSVAGHLDMQLLRIRVFDLPWPRFLAPRVRARERGGDGNFHFDVATSMPGLGHVVAYTGHLELSRLEPLA